MVARRVFLAERWNTLFYGLTYLYGHIVWNRLLEVLNNDHETVLQLLHWTLN